tara:strand:+ start:136 stop:399 length:264 start_codon:yes stop_codon:yes gene_type:complete
MSDTVQKKEKTEWDNRELGALWINVKGNDKYLTGHINNEKVIIFKNKFKDENPKAPDFRVYKQKELGSPAPAEKEAPAAQEEQEDLI